MARRRSKHDAVYFADTAFWIGMLYQRDQYHTSATQWQRWLKRQSARILVTEAILWEILNACSLPSTRTRAAQGFHALYADPKVEIIPFTTVATRQALELYEAASDKSWSLTDCWSFVVMRERHLIQALTSDHHFVQAGFRALLLEDPPE